MLPPLVPITDSPTVFRAAAWETVSKTGVLWKT